MDRSSRLFAANAMSWTKDSRHLILTASTPRAADDEREQQIYALPVDGGELKPLGLSMERTASRMVSADGQRIAFTAETRKQELWVIRNLLSEPAAR
jgi:Tol biopolymer transport system component